MLDWMKKHWMYIILCVFLFALATCFFIVGFTAQNPTEKGKFAVEFLGMNKKDAILFTAYGMGGVLTAIGLVALGRRAEAQVRNNELIEKGHIDERFKAAIANLGSDKSGVRIASFYQFYYLAKGHPDSDFRKSIFEILCVYLRDMTSQKSYHVINEKARMLPTDECQELLNVLFKPEDKTAFSGFPANLWDVYLMGANLEKGNLERAGMSGANLATAHISYANLQYVNLQRADLRKSWLAWANLEHADLVQANLHGAFLEHANLCNANLGLAKLQKSTLNMANLRNTNLFSVIFTDAKLRDADFSGAELSGADFRGAYMDNTIFENAKGLDSAKFDEEVKEIIRKHGRVPLNYNPFG